MPTSPASTSKPVELKAVVNASAEVAAPAAKAVKKRAPARKATSTAVRAAALGDIAPTATPATVAAFVANEATDGAQATALAAAQRLLDPKGKGSVEERAKGLRAILEGAAPDDAKALRQALLADVKGGDKKKSIPTKNSHPIGAMAATRTKT